MERPTVLIVSDDAEFLRAIYSRWQTEGNSPALLTDEGAHPFDLAIVGGTRLSLDTLQRFAKPIIHVSRSNGHPSQFTGVIEIPDVDGWPDLVVTVAKHILERDQAVSALARSVENHLHLERETSLGRYILEMRHNLNNALTSILGNSELMLMDESLSPNLRLQLETIRNMGMRMNEIMQRFSSLQKEIQLAEQQTANKLARGLASSI